MLLVANNEQFYFEVMGESLANLYIVSMSRNDVFYRAILSLVNVLSFRHR